MTQLEKTITRHAYQQLAELRRCLLRPEGADREEDIQSAFWMLSGITLLANLANSGLTDEAAHALHAIDSEAAQAMTAAQLVGVIPKSPD